MSQVDAHRQLHPHQDMFIHHLRRPQDIIHIIQVHIPGHPAPNRPTNRIMIITDHPTDQITITISHYTDRITITINNRSLIDLILFTSIKVIIRIIENDHNKLFLLKDLPEAEVRKYRNNEYKSIYLNMTRFQ